MDCEADASCTVYFYNNDLSSPGANNSANGFIDCSSTNDSSTLPNCYAYNNTLAAGSNAYGAGINLLCPGNYYIDNNVFSGVGKPEAGSCLPLVSNYNDYYNYNTSLWTLAYAQGAGFDLQSTGGNPLLNAEPNDTIASASSAAITAGQNLTSLDISGLDVDAANNSRLASGPWDIGAYQYATSTPSQMFSVLVTGGVTTIGSVLFL